MKKNKPLVFTIADSKNEAYATVLENSLRKFHKEENVDFYIVKGKELEDYLKQDSAFFYRATPILGERFLEEYDLVIKIDADSIICDDISYIWETKDYDVGTVLNYNRIDPKTYGFVQGWGILPPEYMNCGLVSMRSEKFVHHWKVLCFEKQFDRFQYREQDLLNILVYYGNYNVRCFDHYDIPAKMIGWWGLISKGEWGRVEIKDNKLMVPKGIEEIPFPDRDTTIKIIHWGGGKQENKMNYKTRFPEEVVKRIDEITT